MGAGLSALGRCDGAKSLQGLASRRGQLRHVQQQIPVVGYLRAARGQAAKKLLREFRDDPVGMIDLGERFAQRPDRDRDRAILLWVEAEVATQRLDVAVEDEADDLGIPIDHRRARIAADDVVGGGDVERLVEVKRGARRNPGWFRRSSLYALDATGFTLIFGVSGVLNPSHGALMVTAAIAAFVAGSDFGANAGVRHRRAVYATVETDKRIREDEKEIFNDGDFALGHHDQRAGRIFIHQQRQDGAGDCRES